MCISCLSKRTLAVDTPAPYITSIYSFRDPEIKKIVHAIKYFHRKDLIPPLTQKLSEKINESALKNHILVPVPMPLLRKYMRGYNHSEAIAREIAATTNLAMRTDILMRTNTNKRQVVTRSRSERLKNQHGAFTIHSPVVGMDIVLVDDVTTTGATLNEARANLIAHGARSVRAVTIAH